MAASPPSPPQLSPPPPSGDSVKADREAGLEAQIEPLKGKNASPSFIEPQPLREDQVQNAVKFLSHPKVKGSPIVHRRSFLERKGLTKEEIDEAFQRVPDPPSNDAVNVAGPTEGKLTFSQGVLQNQSAFPSSQSLSVKQQPITQQLVGPVSLPISQAPAQLHWSQIVLAVGVLTAAGAGAGLLFKRVLIPKFKAWLRQLVLEEEYASLGNLRKTSPIEESASAAAVAAKAAATVASEVAIVSQEMMKSRTEERKDMTSIVKALESQTQELKISLIALKTSLQNLDKFRPESPLASSQLNEQTISDSHNDEANGTLSILSHGEQVEPRESIKIMSKLSNLGVTPTIANGTYSEPATVLPSFASSTVNHDRTLHSANFKEPLGSSQAQNTYHLPNVLTSSSNIESTPAPDKPGSLAPTSENWSRGNSSVSLQGRYMSFTNAVPASQIDSAEPWWRRKKADPKVHTVSSWPSQSTVKITEVESVIDGDTNGSGNSSQQSSSASHVGGDVNGSSLNFSVAGSRWVPPAVPDTVMPGAAGAIRYKKPIIKDEMRPLPMSEEVSSANTSQFIVTPEVDRLFSSVQQSVKLDRNIEGQEREASELTHLAHPSYKDVVIGEVDSQQELEDMGISSDVLF